jgi:ATP synthase protein I
MNKNKKQFKDYSKTTREIGSYLGLGTQLAATIILMFFLGRWLDQKFETEPILTLLFAIFGGFAGMYNFIKQVLNLNRRKKT